VGAVLLQDSAAGGYGAQPQEPAGLHSHEPHRPQHGAGHSGGKQADRQL